MAFNGSSCSELDLFSSQVVDDLIYDIIRAFNGLMKNVSLRHN